MDWVLKSMNGEMEKNIGFKIVSTKQLKNKARQILRSRRETMTPDERLEKSLIICNHVNNIINDKDIVMVYSSKELEVNTTPLIKLLFDRNVPVVVPIIVKSDTSLRLSYINNLSVLVPSTFGVPEPIGNEIPANPSDISVIILPMMGFDKSGNRLGYGAGYYDKFLATNKSIYKIGIAFSCQELDNIPSAKKDIKMDCIVTDNSKI